MRFLYSYDTWNSIAKFNKHKGHKLHTSFKLILTTSDLFKVLCLFFISKGKSLRAGSEKVKYRPMIQFSGC